jgi:ABC-type multidrug transport system ATPase subunit
VLHGVDLEVRRGDRLAIMGANGIGKSTLLKILMGEMDQDAGSVEWGYETHPGYFAQDHREQFESPAYTAENWIWDSAPEKDIGYVRGAMGLVLFSGDDGKKRLEALSGGEAARLVFCRLALHRPNVLVLDEPTNHLDLESIEALVESLKGYPGTLIFVSHDRWLVGQLATRIVEIRPDMIQDYKGTYEDYVHFCGDDHLDADTVVLKAQREKRQTKETDAPHVMASKEETSGSRPALGKAAKNRLRESRDRIAERVEKLEALVAAIDEQFADSDFYRMTSSEKVRELQEERARLSRELEEQMLVWEAAEAAVLD